MIRTHLFFSLLNLLFVDLDYLLYLVHEKIRSEKNALVLKKGYQFLFYHDNICKSYD